MRLCLPQLVAEARWTGSHTPAVLSWGECCSGDRGTRLASLDLQEFLLFCLFVQVLRWATLPCEAFKGSTNWVLFEAAGWALAISTHQWLVGHKWGGTESQFGLHGTPPTVWAGESCLSAPFWVAPSESEHQCPARLSIDHVWDVPAPLPGHYP